MMRLDVTIFIALSACCFCEVTGFGKPSSSCGKSAGCLYFPSGCEASNSCNLTLVYWKHRGEDKVTFEARAKGNWVGIGVNTAQAMIGTTGEICSCDGISCKVTGFQASARQRPNRFENVAGVTVVSISSSNREIWCRYTRTLKQTASYMKDLSLPYYYLMAAGIVASGDIQYHEGNKFATTSQLKIEDFTDDDGVDTNTVLAITLPLAILIVLLLLGFIVYYYARKRQRSHWGRQRDIYTAGWKYPGRLEPYGYSYRQNPEIYNTNPRALDNYSDDVYRKYQPMYTNEGFHSDMYQGTPKKKRIDPNAQPFNKFFKDARHKSGPAHEVYF